MQILLASAKIMNEAARTATPFRSTPRFREEASLFARELAQMEDEALAEALGCNRQIAHQNRQRYRAFFDEGGLPAILGYFGAAYKSMQAHTFSDADFRFAQEHLWIASFLYGLLRPLDEIHPYRMEGNVRLTATDDRTMFAFWKSRLTDVLINAVRADDGILVHLSTEEFEHLFDWKRVRESVRIIQPSFLVRKGDRLKTVTVYAKMCRGAMARHLITTQATSPEALTDFRFEGFAYSEKDSEADRPCFVV